MAKTADKLTAVEAELYKVQAEYESLSQALRDQAITTWVAEGLT